MYNIKEYFLKEYFLKKNLVYSTQTTFKCAHHVVMAT